MEIIPVSILMATYNGEKYLEEQINSLLKQTYPHWTLWIKDDGSTDSTISIIEQYCLQDSRIHQVSDSNKNLGAGKTFFLLLSYSDTPYTIFCDQDDIWFDTKLEELVRHAEEKLDINRPGMVYCDAHAYSDALRTITSNSVSHLHASNLNEFLFFNSGYQGCSILFNSSLCTMAKNYTADFYMHDDIVSLLGHTFGDVYFLNKPLMLYRQHDYNVTGKTAQGFWDMVRTFFRKGAAVINRHHYDEKKHFFHYYQANLNEKQKKLFEAYLQYPQLSLFKRLWIVWKYNFSLGGHQLILYIKTLIRKPLS